MAFFYDMMKPRIERGIKAKLVIFHYISLTLMNICLLFLILKTEFTVQQNLIDQKEDIKILR